MTKELLVGSHLLFVWVFWPSLKCSVTKGNEGKHIITENLIEQKMWGTKI